MNRTLWCPLGKGVEGQPNKDCLTTCPKKDYCCYREDENGKPV